MKNFFRLLLCVACAYVMAGCEKEEKEKIIYTGQLTFTDSTVDVLKDFTIKLDYTTTNGLLENDILWESADENIATVDSEGNVTGINYGETDITAKYHNNEWSCHIAVNNIIPIPVYTSIDKGDYYLIRLNYPSISNSTDREYKWKENGIWKKYEDNGILIIKQEAAEKYDLTVD